jgi:NAD(P)-dependent dehydrogenase (short-subunit alcohol dehydrogenase family)
VQANRCKSEERLFNNTSCLANYEMQASGGSVVNISSVAGIRYIGKPQVGYAAGKAAIIQFTKVTAVLYAAKGIRLNTVVPGLIDTPLVRRLADKYAGGDYEGFRQTRARQVPAKGWARLLKWHIVYYSWLQKKQAMLQALKLSSMEHLHVAPVRCEPYQCQAN